jgi:hypothetical protein
MQLEHTTMTLLQLLLAFSRLYFGLQQDSAACELPPPNSPPSIC